MTRVGGDDPEDGDGAPADRHGSGAGHDPARRQAAEERRRWRVFGDVLDGSTLDDSPEPGSAATEDDRWLRDNVPPHHGD